jgi:hypothetical protein
MNRLPLHVAGAALVLTVTSCESKEDRDWTRQFGTAADEGARSVAADRAGDVLVAGYAVGDLEGDGAGDGRQAFVAKYGRAGARLWIREIGTPQDDEAYSVATDASGSVLVAGSTQGDLGGRGSAGGVDAFVVKLGSDGERQWVRQFGTSSRDVATSVATDPGGNVYVAGVTEGALDGAPAAGPSDGFVVKLDRDGAEVWRVQLRTSSSDAIMSVATDAEGNVFVAGATFGTLGGVPAAGRGDAFVVSLTPAGFPRWGDQLGTPSEDEAVSIATDAYGGVYVAGLTAGALGDDLAEGGVDAFVVAYDPGGARRWTRQLGTAATDWAASVATAADGSVHVAGKTGGSLRGRPWAGGTDAFVLHLDRHGDMISLRQFGTAADDSATAIATDGAGSILVAGRTAGALDGGTPAGGTDAFVLKWVQP